MIARFTKSGILLLTAGILTLQATAQSSRELSEKKEDNIVIRKKGDSKEKLTIVIDGDQVTVNGKPLDEYKGNNIEISRNMRLSRVTPEPPLPPGGPKMFRGDVLSSFRSNRAFLGVTSEKADEGVRVNDISANSPAEKAGLKKDDIITKVGDTKVGDSQDLYEAIGQYKPEDKVAITYKRDGKEAVAQVTLAKSQLQTLHLRNSNNDFDFRFPEDFGSGNFNFNYLRKPHVGLQVQDTEDGKGVKVLDVADETPADKAGLKKGDIITGINGKNISSVDELRDATQDLKEGSSVQLNYNRNNQSQSTAIKIPKRLKTSNL